MKIDLFSHAGEDRPLAAISLLLVGIFALSLQDSLMKLMSVHTSFWQIQSLRSVGNLLLLFLLASFTGGLVLLKPRNWKPVYLRALFLAICMFFFFSGSPFLSVSQMAAGLYTYPIFVCLLAGPILGETIGVWRTAGVVAGAIGALLVFQPWHDQFTVVQILPIIAGFFFACNVMTLRRGCRYESTLALASTAAQVFIISGAVGITVLSLFPLSTSLQQSMPFVAIGWPDLTLLVFGFGIFASCLNLAGNICMTRAYQTADSSLLAPVDFAYLVFAAFWGKAIFDKWPTGLTLLGMFLIVCAGVIIAWREQLNLNKNKKHQA